MSDSVSNFSPVLFGAKQRNIMPEPEVIVEIDGWRMEEPDPDIIPWLFSSCTQLSHFCPNTKWRQWVSPDVVIDAKACTLCGNKIPDSILAVWHLYNADEITKSLAIINSMETETKAKEKAEVFYPKIWKDSRPIEGVDISHDPGDLYLANGDIHNEEKEWNGSVYASLYSHDGTILELGDDLNKTKATTSAG